MKGLVKYESEDVVPIVMSVFIYIVDGLITLLYAIALEGPLKDLKEQKADHRQIDEVTCELINLLDDDLTITIADLITSLNEAIGSLERNYLLHPQDIYDNERIQEMADEFYWTVVWFAAEANNLKEYHGLLSCFLFSIQHILCLLIQLVEGNEMDYDGINCQNSSIIADELTRLENTFLEDLALLELRGLIAKAIFYNNWMDEYFSNYRYS